MWFERIGNEASAEGVAMNAKATGTPMTVASKIVRYAEKNNVDLIVIGTRGTSGFTKLLMGSVAAEVNAYSPCPVLTVR